MYPATTRLHFIDPAQDVTADADRVLVFREFRDSANGMINTIVDVRKDRHFDGNNLWYITTSGYFVQGAPINPASLSSYQPVLGILSDDLFVVGVLSRENNAPTARINDSLRSDRRTLGGGDLNLRVHHADTWVKAAPWAVRLMPRPTDGVQAATAKLQLAEQLYLTRRAQAGVFAEAIGRGHEEDLSEVQDVPTPVLGAMVKGSVYLPVNERLGDEALAQVQETAAKAAGEVNVRLSSYARVDLSFMYPAEANTREELDASVTNRGMSRHLAAALGNSNVVVGDTAVTPVLRNLV